GDEVRYVFTDARTQGDFVLAALLMARYEQASYIQAAGETTLSGHRIGMWTYNDRFYKSIGSRLDDEECDAPGHFRPDHPGSGRAGLAYIARLEGTAAKISRHATVIETKAMDDAWRQVVRSKAPIETPNGVVYKGILQPSVKLYEVVKGAHLAGA